MPTYADFITELVRNGDGWKMTIRFVSSAGDLVRQMWPFSAGQPYGVSIREGIVLLEPDVEGEFEIFGLDPDAVRQMEEGFAQAFVTAGFDLGGDTPAAGGGTGPQPGEFWLVDSAGAPVQQVHPRQGHVAGPDEPVNAMDDPLAWAAVETLKRSIPLYGAASALAGEQGITVCLGLDGDAAAVVGVTGGIGIYFGPNGEFGWYTSIGADVGWIVGVSAAVALMITQGPPSRVEGDAYALEVSAGEGIVAGLSLLFDAKGEPYGVAGEVGVGLGAPVNFYASWSNTQLRQF